SSCTTPIRSVSIAARAARSRWPTTNNYSKHCGSSATHRSRSAPRGESSERSEHEPGAAQSGRRAVPSPMSRDPFERGLEIEQAQLRGFARSVSEIEWLLLILDLGDAA